MNCLRQSSSLNTPVVRYVLYGRFGSGKTTTLNQIAYWAHSQGWIVVFVDNRKFFAFHFCLDRIFVALRNYFGSVKRSLKLNFMLAFTLAGTWCREWQGTIKSTWNPDRIDLPTLATKFLINFKRMNESLLQGVRL